MSDTHPEVAEVMRRSVLRLTPAERLVMGCDMFDAARALATAGLIAQGETDPSRQRVLLFLRSYADDIETEECARIAGRLADGRVTTRAR